MTRLNNMQTKSQIKYLTSINRLQEPEAVKDRCSNCEKVKTVKAPITYNNRSGNICCDCFILYKK